MALTGSNSEPRGGYGFSDGTTREADGSVSEPRSVFAGCHCSQSFEAVSQPLTRCTGSSESTDQNDCGLRGDFRNETVQQCIGRHN